jgi:4-hydroxy-3-methylbut-2-enyl diphosphate reductase
MMNIVIEEQAGFCFGVVSAIETCEKELSKENVLYCIGDIVHNSEEVERLKKLGLRIIEVSDLEQMHDCKVMIRAHGEPPATYLTAKKNNINIVDATCPIVLKLQKDVKKGYEEMKQCNGQIVIFGKKGHAEVVGLEGQTENTAIVVSKMDDLNKIDFSKPLHIFSQTTKSKEEFLEIVNTIREKKKALAKEDELFVTNSICKRVGSRSKTLLEFADTVDVILFVSGKHSSNGIYLYQLCKAHKQDTFFISSKEDINLEELAKYKTIGISGATSTPMWLMEQIRDYVLEAFENR